MTSPHTPVETDSHDDRRPGEVHIRPVHALVLLATLALAYGGFRVYLTYEITSDVDAIHAAGYPATLDELDAVSPPIEGKNAADLVRAAADYMVDTPADFGWFPMFTGANWTAWDSNRIAALERYLDQNRNALETLYRASTIEPARYASSFGGVPNGGEMVHLRQVLKGSNLLAMDAVLRACQGRGAESARALTASLRIAQTLQAEPSMTSQLIRFTAIQQSVQGLEWMLPHVDLDTDARRDISRELVLLEDATPVARAYVAARCLGMWFYDLPFDRQLVVLGARGSHPELRHFVYRYSGQLELDLLCFYKYMGRFVSLCFLPATQRIDDFDSLVVETRQLPSYYVGSALYFRSMPNLIREFTDLTARARAARTILAIDAYHADHGSMPPSLSALVPAYMDAVLSDPFDGKPLRYTVSGDAHSVFSVGMNRVDEGGPSGAVPHLERALGQALRGPRTTYEFVPDPGLRLVFEGGSR